jgi:protein tyrosine phosphatase (PTP) superfamily phosphohydrolase (DUF442 family)
VALTDICNFHRVSETLATAGQPTEAQFAEIAAAGFEVVINLAWPTDTLDDEDLIVEDAGMEYVALPVRWLHPTVADVQRFFDAMERAAGKRVFVHCIANKRVSTFVFLYRTLRLGDDPREAAPELVRFWTPNRIWLDLIRDVRAVEGAGVK